VQQMTFLFSFSILFGVEQKCILIDRVCRDRGAEQGRRKGNIRTRPTDLLLSSYLAPTLTRPLGPASSTRDTEERLSKSHYSKGNELYTDHDSVSGEGGGGGMLEPKRRHKKTVGFFIYFHYGGW
jgi:hypothetical protein